MNSYTRQVGAGTTFLSPTDFYVEVDTSLGEATVVLPSISTIMEIVAKLGITFAGIRIVDVSDNASVNNIVILSGGNDLVNNASSITLNTNGVGGTFNTLSGVEWAYAQNSVASPLVPVNYRILKANITQSGTDDAVLNILDNTLDGTPTVTTDLDSGNFNVTLEGAFSTADKVWCNIKPSEFRDVYISIYHNDSDSVRITCRDIATGLGASNKMYEHSFEIIVYN